MLVLLFAFAPQAEAAIISTTGAMTVIAPPASVVPEALESSSTIFVFDEGTKILTAPAVVNAFGPGVHTGSIATLATIPAGSKVNTYFVHFDPDGGVVGLTGAVFFQSDEIILGIQTHTPLIDATDADAGFGGTIYPTGTAATRGFESLPGLDTVTIPVGLGSASFSLIAELAIDQARIFTFIVPEPSSLALVAMAGLGLLTVAFGRRKA